jgi:hypothetical protein
MKRTIAHNFVEWIGDEKVRVCLVDGSGADTVLKLGGKFSLLSRAKAKLHYRTDAELHRILQKLRDDGFAFVGGPAGWPPAAVFEDLRVKGKVSGDFLEIVWQDLETTSVRRR